MLVIIPDDVNFAKNYVSILPDCDAQWMKRKELLISSD